MFESIIIRPNSSRGHPLDFGQVIENLFFYGKTIVHIGRGEIKHLYELADVYVLEELLKFQDLAVYFNNSHTGVANRDGLRSVDSFGLADLDLEKLLYNESFEHNKDDAKSKKFSKKVSRLIGVYELPNDINRSLDEQLRDNDFRYKVLVESLHKYLPDKVFKKEDLRFDLEYVDSSQFKVHSNIDFSDPAKFAIDTPILSLINSVEDLYVMAQSGSEISAPEYNSKILQIKTKEIIEKGFQNRKEIEVFNHYVFNDSWALREAINRKDIHVKAILDTLRKAKQYKQWLKDLPNDSNLMGEYVRKIQEKSVLERLPAKAIRFYLFSGLSAILGAANPAFAVPLTIGANAFESLFFDMLIKKWTPSQFVESELRPLLKN
jgi:hypothetical protein